MADETEASLHFAPDWKGQICNASGHFFDPRVERDYQEAVAASAKVLLTVKGNLYREEAAKHARDQYEVKALVKGLAWSEAEHCVDSLDWKRHQMSLADPDPKAAGRIRIVSDFTREDSLAEVSRSEMNAALESGAYPTLRASGVNFVGLGRRDMGLSSDQVIDHFALPRDKSSESEGPAHRSDLRLSYRLEGQGKGAQFALVDDCASGRWTIKEPGRPIKTYARRGGGQQAVILQGGEQFAVTRAHEKALAWNRAARRPETVGLKESALERYPASASQHRQSLTFSRQKSL